MIITDKYTNDIAQMLRVFRAHYNLTQSQLAERVGRNQGTIARWESEGEKLELSTKLEIRYLVEKLEADLCKIS